VIYSSTLSNERTEQEGDTTHEVLNTDEDVSGHIERLMDDKFFNGYKRYNIIRS
jgi:hypothetical protein